MKFLPILLALTAVLLHAIPAHAFYDARQGRWLIRDPIEEAGGKNLLCFVQNDPVTAIDKDGRITVSEVLIAGGKNGGGTFKGDCGEFRVFWNFVLDSPSKEDGYLVQEVTISDKYKPCGTKGKRSLTTYWEYWTVSANSTIPVGKISGYTDQASQIGTGPSEGIYVSRGEIKFFYKSTTGDLDAPGSGWKPGDDPRSGLLPSTTQKPIWWNRDSDNGEKSSSRIASATWDCCCAKKNQFSTIYWRP